MLYPENVMTDEFYTPQEAAKILKVSTRTVYEYLRSGRLKAVRVGRPWLIPANQGKPEVEPKDAA